MTRYPVPAEGVNLSSYDFFTKHLPNAPDGVYTAEASPVDGVARTVGYHSLKDLGLIVTASMSRFQHDGGVLGAGALDVAGRGAGFHRDGGPVRLGDHAAAAPRALPRATCRRRSRRTACCSRKSITG